MRTADVPVCSKFTDNVQDSGCTQLAQKRVQTTPGTSEADKHSGFNHLDITHLRTYADLYGPDRRCDTP